MSCARLLNLTALLALVAPSALADWQPKRAPLMTRWAADVDPQNVHPEYPRPQMVRKNNWQNLNGLWEYAITGQDVQTPETFDGEILVPFPVESALSGVMQRVQPTERLWYRRTVELSDRVAPQKQGERVLLHFGAVEWETRVWVNGTEVGTHRGGYDPLTFDITDALTDDGPQEIVVAVTDPTNQGTQPIGKQHLNPHGIWYTPTTGIWQTVWLERVPATYIKAIRIVPDVDGNTVTVQAEVEGKADGVAVYVVAAVPREPGKDSGPASGTHGSPGGTLRLELPDEARSHLWTPDTPHLFDLTVSLKKGRGEIVGPTIDEVRAYFAMRKISLGKDDEGITRLLLNDKPLFQYGLLDQGFWPDGLYTAPTDEALRYDVEMTKNLGFNMARKHVKVEPARWYYWCDKLGLLVWQDMPSGERHIRRDQPDIVRSPESAAQYEREWTAIINALRNHPSIVMWVPFNEGWGQYDTARITRMTKELDPTRLVNSASGWTDRGTGDVHDIHVYPGPGMPAPEDDRAAVLGEFGGLGLPIKGHTWQDEKNWGYRSFQTKEELTDAYLALVGQLRLLIGKGLSAAVYTQTTDVEIEVNGLLTYDRAVLKVPLERVRKAHAKLHLPPPQVKQVVATSETQGQTWRYTTDPPPQGWEQPEFDAAAWQEGPGGFGQKGTPGAVVRTEWTTPDIWLRRTVALPQTDFSDLHLRLHHDEDAEVYLNGRRIARVTGYTTDYVLLPLGEAARDALRPGENVLAVHCHQTGGGQYIDVGLVDVIEAQP